MKIVIVDDIRLARSELASMLKHYKDIEIVGMAEDSSSAYELISREQPDLVFLDIKMPGGGGFELLRHLGDHSPPVIFTTAYEEHAVTSFSFNVVDYLLKPIEEVRLERAIHRARKLEHEIEAQLDSEIDGPVLVKHKDSCHLININEIIYIENSRGATIIQTHSFRAETSKALSTIEKRLSQRIFFRANRNQIVNLNMVNRITHCLSDSSYKIIMKDGSIILVTRRQAVKMKSLFGL